MGAGHIRLWVLAAIALSFGVGIWLSALNVLYRDVRYTFGFLLQIWLFASPVIYSSSLVRGEWRYVYAANPMVGLIDGFRWAAFGSSSLGPADTLSLLTGASTLVAGVLYFTWANRQLADRI